jgi:thymidylate synthase (FAD)
MSVKLIAITKPVIDGIDTACDLISFCARVSNPSNQLNLETAPKLLKYLITHKHWSPYEMASATVEIVTSRAIAAQILRHKSFSFQEFSQRYSTSTELTNIEWREQGKTNRQVGDNPVELSEELAEAVDKHQSQSLNLYSELIGFGIAKECARMVLPLNTKTTMYMAGTIRSFIHYIDLRSQKDTQKEHQDIANGLKVIFSDQFPVISEVMGWKN